MCQANTQEIQDVGTFFTRGWQRGDTSSVLGCSSSTPEQRLKDQPSVLSIWQTESTKHLEGTCRGSPHLALAEKLACFGLTSLLSGSGAPWKALSLWAAPTVGPFEATKVPLWARGLPRLPRRQLGSKGWVNLPMHPVTKIPARGAGEECPCP